ncbi:uncharacterized protein [Salminus brasiliensis]|uniref:uncharacterized protein isoform X2 n=1 Tax=Salminus brasiliensis TaxID=930266 RepID=UPI003B8374F1
MELLAMAVFLYTLYSTQGLKVRNVSSHDGHTEEPSGLHTLKLSQTCSGTLGTLHNGSWVGVTLKPLSPKENETLAQQICTDLGCGGVFEFGENRTIPNNTCLTDCIIRNSTLHNCTTTQGNCFKVIEVVCEHAVVRLGPDNASCAGRVELRYNGKWGTVCDDEWDLSGAGVVCAQLGCGTAVHAVKGHTFGPGTGPIHISKLNCSGTESNIWQCRTRHGPEDSNYCGHKEDAGVVCSGSRTVTVPPTNATEPNVTHWTTGSKSVTEAKDKSRSLSAPVWGCIVLSIALLLVLLSNVALCKHYKRKNACVIHQSYNNSNMGEDGTMNNLHVVTSRAVTVQTSMYGASEARRPSLHEETSETSSDSNYECYYNFSSQSPYDVNVMQTSEDAPVVGECSQAQEKICMEETTLKNTTSCDVLDSESTSSGECYENTKAEETPLNPDANQLYPEHSLQRPPLLSTYQSSKRNPDASDSDSTSSDECYENTGMEVEASLQTLEESPSLHEQNPLIHYTPQPTGNSSLLEPSSPNQEASDSDSTSSDECYENTGMEVEASLQTLEESPSLHEQNPLIHYTPQPTGNSSLLEPSSPNQDDSSTSSDDAYENVPEIDEEDCQSSSSDDYDDVGNW